ncbi:EAL domain-containing protein [Oxynema sp. CENA135]|uniref:EAL domain-containing protein n=1 Tax=Oxynema sp. CENA135 TaxID=984206 RepID=UPI00190D1E02|nr:EAL domain-containing protein [Oxynema sp. CENA135]MBK4731540.1 EAL domain-containing protein [Oxynema sp. CENA135]
MVVKRRVTRQLRRSTIVYVLLGAFALSSAISALGIVPVYEALKRREEENLLLAAQGTAQALGDYFSRAKGIALQVSSRSEARQQLAAYDRAEISQADLVRFNREILQDALEASPEIVGITRIDRLGRPVGTVGIAGGGVLTRVLEEQARQNELEASVEIVDSSLLAVSSPILVREATPKEYRQWRQVGIDLVWFDLEALKQRINRHPYFKKQKEYLLVAIDNGHLENLVPLSSDTARSLAREEWAELETLTQFVRNREGLLELGRDLPSPMTVAYTPIAENAAILALAVPTRQLYAPVRRQLSILVPATLVAIVFGIGGTVVCLHLVAGRALLHSNQLEKLLLENRAHLEQQQRERQHVETQLASHARASALVAGLGQWALAGMDVRTLIEETSNLVNQILGVEYCSVWELQDNGHLCLRTGAGWPSETLASTVGGRGTESQAGYTLLVKEAVIVEDLGAEMRFTPSPSAIALGIVSSVSTVIYGNDRPFGVLSAETTKKRQFGSHEVYFLQAIANVLATAIERQRHDRMLRDREEQYALAVAGANDGLWDWNLNEDTIYFSPRWKSLLGYEEAEIGNQPQEWFDLIHEDDRERILEQIATHLAGKSKHLIGEYRMLDADGHYRWMLCRGLAVRDGDGKAYRMAGSHTDISDRKAAEAQNLYLAAFPTYNPNPVLACDANGEATYVNPATERVLDELRVGLATGFLPVNHRQIVETCLQHGNRSIQVERWIQDRVFSWIYHPIPNLQLVHLHAIDITDRSRAEERLRHEALHDSLTGLPNRALFFQRLTHALEQSKSPARPLFAVLFLDLDRFKVVNDSLGHSMGDCLLVSLAERVQRCIRPSDILARFGGDEFTLLLEHLGDIDEAIAVARRIDDELTQPFNLAGHEVFVTASIGIAPSCFEYHCPEELIRDADLALYRAKAAGKARYALFDRTMLDRAVALLSLENDLRRSIYQQNRDADAAESGAIAREDAFVLHYQPIVALDTGSVEGFEALIRWQHPQRGLIWPGEFIEIAEETGLIVPLGAWVLRQACWQLCQWQRQFPKYANLTMSVNLSGQQLAQPDLIEQIDRILEETGIDPKDLKLEITESVLMENAASAAELLEQLRSRHIHLCIDDFGTGYSSLSHLAQFPINTLKIDKSFVMGMEESPENQEIVRAIVMLGRNLGMYITAEGVETEENLVQLWALQSDYAQGILFSPALDRQAAEALLERNPRW